MSSCAALEGRSRSIGSGQVSDTLDYQNDQLISDHPIIWTLKVLPVKGKMVVIVEGRPTTIITSIALKRRRLPEKRNILPNRAARGRININNNDNNNNNNDNYIIITRPGCFCAKDCLDSVEMYKWWYTFTWYGLSWHFRMTLRPVSSFSWRWEAPGFIVSKSGAPCTFVTVGEEK